MASLAESLPPVPAQAGPIRRLLARPSLCFWIAGLVVYGLAAWNFSGGHFLNQTSRDLWQHLASLRALIENPFDPANPFVATGEGSRHFHPYWVSVALVARAFGWNAWQAIAFAGFVSAGTLLAGTYAFGRAFYRSPWGPLALLVAMAFGWCLPVSHTGYHSLGTLIEGIAYPAALLIGLSLLLWALVIRALEKPVLALWIVPLAAFMFATHQLGAGIGFMAAGCFILLWPDSTLKRRAAAAAAVAAGILLSTAWPYHNPFEAIARTGIPTWSGGINFYHPVMLIIAFVPSSLGLWGLRHRRFSRTGLPVLAAALLFAGIFALGWFGLLIATRFVMPAVLMLQIGLGALFLALVDDWRTLPRAAQLGLFAFALLCLSLFGVMTRAQLAVEQQIADKEGNSYAAALALTRDIPDSEPVAAYDVFAWPIVATGQRVVSVPWPEPMIDGLAERQAAAERLFDPALTRDQRLRLARHWGAKVLIMDKKGPLRRKMPKRMLATLQAQSVRTTEAGHFIRFDLE
ncbi:MAG TPA: hypothetical protein VFQ67_10850 [Allosphingosinicella sp.]|jgi:hypothetical protein|nr:hypothetical protein [Allosphingosinicella sp.]